MSEPKYPYRKSKKKTGHFPPDFFPVSGQFMWNVRAGEGGFRRTGRNLQKQVIACRNGGRMIFQRLQALNLWFFQVFVANRD